MCYVDLDCFLLTNHYNKVNNSMYVVMLKNELPGMKFRFLSYNICVALLSRCTSIQFFDNLHTFLMKKLFA